MLPALDALGSQVQMMLDEIDRIVKVNMADSREAADDARSVFAKGAIPAGSFSSVDIAGEIAAQAAAAHEVFTSTLDGVRTDLLKFQSALHEARQSYDDTDTGSHQALLAIAVKMKDYNYRSSDNYNKARRDAGSALPTQQRADEDAAANPMQHPAAGAQQGGHGGSRPSMS